MKNETEMGYGEKHRRYYSKVTKLYFEDGLGYLRTCKLGSADFLKNTLITLIISIYLFIFSRLMIGINARFYIN